MVAAGEEQQVDLSQELDRKVILETYAHEVDETYVVTIDGESIEATPEHPFYNAEGEEVQAKDLKEGDELATAYGDTATVDSVECIHHDEPVMVYNIAVCDSHTYFVGENHVLVHNMCPPKKDAPNPNDGHKIGENGTQVTSKTTWQNGPTERIDVENPAPGVRDGNIHYHDSNNSKYLYDMLNNQFINNETGELAPNSIQKLLGNSSIQRGIEKGKRILGE